jgi:hypothetical protein
MHAYIFVNILLTNMSKVLGIRISKKLEEELREFNIDYAAEARACFERAVKQQKTKKIMEQIDKHRDEAYKKTGLTPSSADMIREDRDHDHS